MKSLGLIPIVAWLLLSVAEAAVPVFECDFEAADVLSRWQSSSPLRVRLEPARDQSHALHVEAPAGVTTNASARLALPLDGLRGTRVHVEALVKAEGVTAPPKPWNGIKVMLNTHSPDGETWEQQNQVAGTFAWKRLSFSARVPADASAAWLVVGLEAVNGVAWFDDVRITVTARSRVRPEKPTAGVAFTGHKEPRLRGAMISPNVTVEDLEVLGGRWGANHVRWQLLWGGFLSFNLT